MILRAENLVKEYKGRRVVNEVSVNINQGEIVGLLGPNGAGKTTLIRIINQIIEGDSGEVYFNGEILQPKHISQIGYLPEERGLYKKMKVWDQLVYFARLKDMPAALAKERVAFWLKKMDKKGTIREELGVSQSDLAIVLKVSKTQLAMYETGRRDLPTDVLLKLADMVIFVRKVKNSSIETAAYLKEENKKFIMALESDAGGFTPRGFGYTANATQKELLLKWKPLFHPYGALEFNEGGGGADIGPLRGLGTVLIGLNPDSQRYMDLHAVEPKGAVCVVLCESHWGQGTSTARVAWRLNCSTLFPVAAVLPHCGGAMP